MLLQGSYLPNMAEHQELVPRPILENVDEDTASLLAPNIKSALTMLNDALLAYEMQGNESSLCSF